MSSPEGSLYQERRQQPLHTPLPLKGPASQVLPALPPGQWSSTGNDPALPAVGKRKVRGFRLQSFFLFANLQTIQLGALSRWESSGAEVHISPLVIVQLQQSSLPWLLVMRP